MTRSTFSSAVLQRRFADEGAVRPTLPEDYGDPLDGLGERVLEGVAFG